MKSLFLLGTLGLLVGCGEDASTPYDGNESVSNEVIYTLEPDYEFTVQNYRVVVGGFSEPLGSAHWAGAYVYLSDQDRVGCGLRILVQKDTGPNHYTFKIGASEWPDEECGILRGNYTMVLTGEKTADIEWIDEEIGFF